MWLVIALLPGLVGGRGLVEHLLNGGVWLTVHHHHVVGEVYAGRHGLMQTAHIQHELAVDEHPKVIVAGELEGNGVAKFIQAVRRHRELHRHVHTKVMVQILIVVHADAIVWISVSAMSAIGIGIRFIRVEGEEADGLAVAGLVLSRMLLVGVLVDLEAVRIRIVPCVVLIAVVVIVTV